MDHLKFLQLLLEQLYSFGSIYGKFSGGLSGYTNYLFFATFAIFNVYFAHGILKRHCFPGEIDKVIQL